MSPMDKKMGSRISIKPLTSLQRLMISTEFDFFIIVIIILNCIFMALESPILEVIPTYIVVSNYFFNVSI